MLQLINKRVLKQCCINSKKITDLNARAETTILRIKYRNISLSPWIRQWFLAYNIKSINDKRQKQINRTVSKLKAFVLQMVPPPNPQNGRKDDDIWKSYIWEGTAIQNT